RVLRLERQPQCISSNAPWHEWARKLSWRHCRGSTLMYAHRFACLVLGLLATTPVSLVLSSDCRVRSSEKDSAGWSVGAVLLPSVGRAPNLRLQPNGAGASDAPPAEPDVNSR